MQLHLLKSKTNFRRGQRVGRGSKRGKTSGRGTKGQKARAGAKIRPALRDVIKKLPKLRGRGKHTFRSFQIKPAIVNLGDLETHFANGETIDQKSLLAKGLISTIGGRVPQVKVLGDGELTKRFTFKGLRVSRPARAKIERAGGSLS